MDFLFLCPAGIWNRLLSRRGLHLALCFNAKCIANVAWTGKDCYQSSVKVGLLWQQFDYSLGYLHVISATKVPYFVALRTWKGKLCKILGKKRTPILTHVHHFPMLYIIWWKRCTINERVVYLVAMFMRMLINNSLVTDQGNGCETWTK